MFPIDNAKFNHNPATLQPCNLVTPRTIHLIFHILHLAQQAQPEGNFQGSVADAALRDGKSLAGAKRVDHVGDRPLEVLVGHVRVDGQLELSADQLGEVKLNAPADGEAAAPFAHTAFKGVDAVLHQLRVALAELFQVSADGIVAADTAKIIILGAATGAKRKFLLGTDQQADVVKLKLFRLKAKTAQRVKILVAVGAAFYVVAQLRKQGAFVRFVVDRLHRQGSVPGKQQLPIEGIVPFLGADGRPHIKNISRGLCG